MPSTLYNNAAVDDTWDNVLNWWQDSSFTTPALSIPVDGDTAYIEGTINSGPSIAVTLAALLISQINDGSLLTDIGAWPGMITVSGVLTVGTAGANSGGIATISGGYMTVGSAVFYGSSTSGIGLLTGNVTLNDSVNYSYNIVGDVIFNDSSSIGDDIGDGSIVGDAVFNDSSFNNCTIEGDVVFNDTSQNSTYGTINGDSTFNDSSANQNNINGDAAFNDNSFNNYIINGNATFNDSATNQYTVSGVATFTPSAAVAMISNNWTGTYGSVVVPAGSDILGAGLL